MVSWENRISKHIWSAHLFKMELVPAKETARQYRVLGQSLSMHSWLREEYSRKARAAEIILLVSSLIFCVTTFTGNEFFAFFKVGEEAGRTILGLASTAAFASSLVILVIDWRGHAALHGEAVDRFHEALQKFRERQRDDGSWPSEKRSELASAYREVNKNTIDIPNRRFDELKARYLRQKTINRLKDQYPGCPRIFLILIARVRDTYRALEHVISRTKNKEKADS